MLDDAPLLELDDIIGPELLDDCPALELAELIGVELLLCVEELLELGSLMTKVDESPPQPLSARSANTLDVKSIIFFNIFLYKLYYGKIQLNEKT